MNIRNRNDVDWFDMPEISYRASRIFRALGNPKAYAFLKLLLQEEILSVHEICARLNRKQPGVSKMLRTLRDLDLIRYQREGSTAIYTFKDGESLQSMLGSAELVVQHSMEAGGKVDVVRESSR